MYEWSKQARANELEEALQRQQQSGRPVASGAEEQGLMN